MHCFLRCYPLERTQIYPPVSSELEKNIWTIVSCSALLFQPQSSGRTQTPINPRSSAHCHQPDEESASRFYFPFQNHQRLSWWSSDVDHAFFKATRAWKEWCSGCGLNRQWTHKSHVELWNQDSRIFIIKSVPMSDLVFFLQNIHHEGLSNASTYSELIICLLLASKNGRWP